PRSRQRHDLYAKYHDYDSEISDLLGECGVCPVERRFQPTVSFATEPPQALALRREPKANVGRYDDLRAHSTGGRHAS
ncbi:hypothetical protein, partial [Paracoccus binzhouensis]|uniref:hypothetical protein n=1 Tax=Paracoccus binzhouensis TaxID=2796149 RepID=UPI001E3F58EC